MDVRDSTGTPPQDILARTSFGGPSPSRGRGRGLLAWTPPFSRSSGRGLPKREPIAHTAMLEVYEARYYPTNLLQDSMNPKGECCPVRAYAVLSGHIICTRHSNLCLAFFGHDHCSQATIVHKCKSTKVQTLGELRMRGTANGWAELGYWRLLAVSR